MMKSLLITALLLLAPLSTVASVGTYEAELPKNLATTPDLCQAIDCQSVMPQAISFSQRKGQPFFVEAFNAEKKLIGYVFLSTDIVDIPAYSGKPVITLIGLDRLGNFTGIKVLKHSEPILLLGIPEQQLLDFVAQYQGKNIRQKIEVGKASGADEIGIDAITGATVTVIAENQTIMRSASNVARQVGILPANQRPQAQLVDLPQKLGWWKLVADGLVQRLQLSNKTLGKTGSGDALDLYFAYLNSPQIGRSLLGNAVWSRLMQSLQPNEHAIMVVSNGSESFKGSGFVRGGIYDRINISQDGDSYSFRDHDYQPLYHIAAEGAPAFNETGIFILRDSSFSAAFPWQFVFLGNVQDKQTHERQFVSFKRDYWLPATQLLNGRPDVKLDNTWRRVWQAKMVSIAFFCAWLISISIVYSQRDTLVRLSTRKNKWPVSLPKYLSWLIAIGFAGFGLMAQPSVTQILTWFHSVIFEWRWELFLSDPFIFIFWWFIFFTMFTWGRGLFCGWLCPYGSLSELLFKVAQRTPLQRFQFEMPARYHDKMKWIKYVLFVGLLALSFYSMTLAEQLAEVEPFKTTFLVGVWNRSWPFALYLGVLLVWSLLQERPFCKYLCPLGAGLAIPSTFRQFGLKRKAECTTCKACAVGCASHAINAKGEIDPRECLLCLDCMVMYYEPHACPPLAQERKRRQRDNIPLTPINDEGYYIPIRIDEKPPTS